MLDLEPANALRGMSMLESCGLRSRVPVALVDFADPAKRKDSFEHRNMLVFQVWHPDDPFCSVDVFIRNPIDFEALWSRSKIQRLGFTTCRIVSIRDLIAMKRIADRPQDRSDIEAWQRIEKLTGERGDDESV